MNYRRILRDIETGERICFKCRKPESEVVFTPKPKGGIRVRCDECTKLQRAYDRKHGAKNRERKKKYRKMVAEHISHQKRTYYEANRGAILDRGQRYRADIPIRRMIAAKFRAKKYGFDFDLDINYLRSIFPEDGYCECCGNEFVDGNKTHYRVCSLDRVDSDKGYVRGNVRFICRRCNWIKNNGSLKEIENVLNYVKRWLPNQSEPPNEPSVAVVEKTVTVEKTEVTKKEPTEGTRCLYPSNRETA